MSKYSDEIKTVARSLFLKKWTPKEIAEELSLPSPRIIYYWSDKYGWADLLSAEDLDDLIARRLQVLIPKDKKTVLELDEIDRLIDKEIKIRAQKNKHLEKMATIGAANNDHYCQDESDDQDSEKPQRKRKKNDVSGITEADFQPFIDNLFAYQKKFLDARFNRIRNWLKSRQVGATWLMAFEALMDAILTGDPQIFLSASRPQAEVFRTYIIAIAREYLGVTLTGNPITLSNSAVLRFLSTNSNTAQSYHGHVYVDEYFWIRDFKKLNRLASAMATHKQWRKTYISTPSSKMHQAYAFWSGEEWKKGKKERENVEFPEFSAMQQGILCPDRQWRFITTIEDACRDGADKLFDIDELRDEYGEIAFNQLYMCVFTDSGDSVFKYTQVEQCAINTELWNDYAANDDRPFANREVWAGYDPSRTTDKATFVIVAPPVAEDEGFRVLAVFKWHGMNFKYQASQIKKLYQRFHMTYIGIDITGIGRGVYEMVQDFALREVSPISYSVESKNRLVMKMIDVVENKRLAWDGSDKTIAASFMAIRRTSTASGNAMTFVADRSEETGHADVFFAISHALYKEPLNNERKRKSTWAMSKAA
nr:terminase family protein [Limnobaculum xujianqingii]